MSLLCNNGEGQNRSEVLILGESYTCEVILGVTPSQTWPGRRQFYVVAPPAKVYVRRDQWRELVSDPRSGRTDAVIFPALNNFDKPSGLTSRFTASGNLFQGAYGVTVEGEMIVCVANPSPKEAACQRYVYQRTLELRR